ncbi:MAG: TlpA family protein disulfide reductase [Bacteroidales bacterium]|nr:TlpA family protein disulfide reductase [Bacteroidales bacterium]
MLCCACQMGEPETKVTEKVRVGSPLPAFTIVLNDGRIVTNESLRGKVVVLAFFSTKCNDCRREMPEVERFYRMTREGGMPVEVIAISRGEDASMVVPFWSELSLTMPYSAQPTRHVYELFATGIVPRIYVADTRGMIIAAYSDSHMPSAEELRNEISCSVACSFF